MIKNGSAVLAIIVALLGGALVVGGVRGTYANVWQALTSPSANPSGLGGGGAHATSH